MRNISIIIYGKDDFREKLFYMCNYYFQNLKHQSPRNTPSHHQNKNPPEVSFVPIHIKGLHRKNLFVKNSRFQQGSNLQPTD